MSEIRKDRRGAGVSVPSGICYMSSVMANSCHHEGGPRGLDINRAYEALFFCIIVLYVLSVFLSLALNP